MLDRKEIFIEGIFKHMIPGDDALLKMSAAFYKRLGIGGEIYPYPAESIEPLRGMLPAERCCTAHLAHALNFLEEESREQIVEYGRCGSGFLRGMVVHDSRAVAEHPQQALEAVKSLSRELENIDSPLLFIEYACGMDTQDFLEFIRQFKGLPRIGACVDIGHVAVAACRKEYKRLTGDEIFSVRIDHPDLRSKMDDITRSMATARQRTIIFAGEASSIGIPLHFHLHDAHPLSWFSPFGVRDHLPFFWQIPLPFEYNGCAVSDCIFGYQGLREVLRQVIHSGVERPVSLMLEIHPQEGLKALGDYGELFHHWQDKHNAMHHRYWLELIAHCVVMVRQALFDAFGDCRH